MKRLTYCVLTLSLITFAAVAADDEGWVELFNGRDLEGWEQKGGEAKYEVQDGAIVGTCVPNTGNSFMCTKGTYGDFILDFEFKGHPNLNSGVQIRSDSRGSGKRGRVFGYQCELEDEAQARDWSAGIYDEARRGWLFPTKEDTEEAKEHGKKFGEQGKRLWKDGEWNAIRIEAKGDSIKTYLNGELRTDLTDDETPTGFIGLQVHGVGDKTTPMSVSWRKIRIKELK